MAAYWTWHSIGLLSGSNLAQAGVWIAWAATKSVPAHATHTSTTAALAQSEKAHINVDIVFNRLPAGVRNIFMRFNHLVCLLVMILVTRMSIQRIWELKKTGEASLLLKIPDYPFAVFLVIGCVVFCIEFLKDLLGPKHTRGEYTES